MINEWIAELKSIVKTEPDRYAVHKQCEPILKKMAGSSAFLFDVIRFNLSNPTFLQRQRTYPTLSMDIEQENDFTLVVNIFPSLPNGNTQTSFQSIHHHGSLLLSTVGVVGPGYQSIIFDKNFKIDSKNGHTKMTVIKSYQNKLGAVDFIDSYQPHIVFYPASISATFAFWCDDRRRAKDAIKKIGLLKNIKKPAAKLIHSLGLSKILGLNKVEYFDFYAANGNIIALKERLAYDSIGDNNNFLQNIFYFIQQAGFNDFDFLTTLLENQSTPAQAKIYIKKLIEGETLEGDFYNGHLNIPKVNLNMNDVLNAVQHA